MPCPSWMCAGSDLPVHLAQRIDVISGSAIPHIPGFSPGCKLQAGLQNIPSTPVLPASPLLARLTHLNNLPCTLDVCFPGQCRVAIPLLYFVRASREIVSCQLNWRWRKAWSWETTQHLNLCLFCQLIVNLVYKANESGEMGFLSLRRR